METVDLQEVRKHLPMGSIVKIAAKVNLSPAAVSQVFRGRFPRYKNAVLEVALEIIRAKQESEKNVVEKAKQLGFITSEFAVPYQRKKKKNPVHRVTFTDLYVMNEDQINAYQKEKGSKVDYDDYSGVFTSTETSSIRFLKALCKEQGIKVPTWDDLKKMNHAGLMKVTTDLKMEVDPEHYPDDPEGNDEFRNDLADRLQLTSAEE